VTEASTTIFVGNLTYQQTEEELQNFFEDCGEVVSVRIAKDRETNKVGFASFSSLLQSKGFGHVEFTNKTSVESAMKKNGDSLNGRNIKVDVAAERQSSSGSFGGQQSTKFSVFLIS